MSDPSTDDSTDPQSSTASEPSPSGDSTSDGEPAPPEPSPSTPSSGPPSSEEDGAALGELDKVRDLIVGEHAREMTERIERFETRVEDQLGTLRTDLQKQIDGLDTFAREEQESLAEKVSDLKTAHRKAVADLEQQVQDLKRELTDTRDELEDALDRVERNFREQLREQEKELSQEISDRHAELSAMIEEAVDRLRDDATDRRDLATLFEQVATHLRE